MQDAAYVQRDETPSRTERTPSEREAARQRQLAGLKRVPKGGPSPNPSGRPKKDLDLAREAQKHAMLAIKTLADVCGNEEAPPASRISAASELLDRGYGRAPQSIKLNAELSFGEQFEDFIRQLNARTIEHEQPRLAAKDPGVVDVTAEVCDGSARGDA